MTLDLNIYVMDIDNLPVLNSRIYAWDALVYKSENKLKQQLWLLLDGEHYNAISNIRGFLAVNCFVIHVYNVLNIKISLIITNVPIIEKLERNNLKDLLNM